MLSTACRAIVRLFLPGLVVVAALAAACADRDPARQYVLKGQILAVHPERMELTIHHEEIPNLMASMTMTFPVAEKRLLDGRVPGETVTATLEVRNATGRLVSITHTGSAPLPSAASGGTAGVLTIGDPVPDAAFVDQSDRRRSFAEWRGTVTLVTFVETRCPPADECARIREHFAALQRAITRDPATRERLRLVTITTDPAYDTAMRLAAEATNLGTEPKVWTLLTGDAVTVQRFAGRFGVDTTTHPLPVGGRRTALIDGSGRLRRLYSGAEWTPAAVLEDMRRAGEPR